MVAPNIQYGEGNTVLHRMHPLAKLFVFLVLCCSIFIFEGWVFGAGITVVIFALYLVPERGILRLWSVLRIMPLFSLLIVLANLFLLRSGLSVQQRIMRGLLQSVRVVDILAATSLFLAVTDPIDLSDSAINALKPLRRLGVRIGELSLMVMVIFSFIPQLFDEARRLRLAQSIRSGPARGVSGFFRNVVPLLAPLVIGVFRRADEMELALRARFFSLARPRTPVHMRKVGWFDVAVCMLAIALFVVGVYAKF
jgi:energy-coupling factor transport system permease protein